MFHSVLSMTRLGYTILLLSALIICGCDTESDGVDTSATGGDGAPVDPNNSDGTFLDRFPTDAGEGDYEQDEETDGGVGVSSCPTSSPFNDDFLILYGLRGRVPGDNQDEFEVFVSTGAGLNPVNPDSLDPLSITEFSLKGAEHKWCPEDEAWSLSCKYGCVIDDGMQWIGVGVPVPSAQELDPTSEEYNPNYACLTEDENPPLASEGFSVWLGQLTSQLKANMLKGAILRNVSHFTFKAGKMFYSRRNPCTGPSCTYDILMRDLSVNVNEEIKLLEFPPSQEHLNGSIYKGYFTVSEDGKAISFLNPTIRSQSYFTWVEEKGLSFLKTLCETEENGKCIGTGSAYSDRDPAALSPDPEHEYLVTMTVAENNQRVWRYRTNAEGEPKWTNVVSTPPGTSYWNNACSHMSEPWHYERVEGMQFTPDGESVVYLGRSDCSGIGLKPETDLMEMPISIIGNGKPIQPEDIRNITNNPKTTTASNIVLGNFDLCGNGEVFVASGTPSVDDDGKPLDDENQATKSDKELYLFSKDGCFRKQMTKNVAYEVTSVQCVPNPFAIAQ